MENKRSRRIIRHHRVKHKIENAKKTPRLVVFRSNKFIYAQIIDDMNSKTIVASSDIKTKTPVRNASQSVAGGKVSKLERAKQIGSQIAKEATAKNIKKVVFDRAGYRYHGRVRALAEGAREGGLVF